MRYFEQRLKQGGKLGLQLSLIIIPVATIKVADNFSNDLARLDKFLMEL